MLFSRSVSLPPPARQPLALFGQQHFIPQLLRGLEPTLHANSKLPLPAPQPPSLFGQQYPNYLIPRHLQVLEAASDADPRLQRSPSVIHEVPHAVPRIDLVPRRAPSVISLTESESSREVDHQSSPPPIPRPLIEWGSASCVRSHGESRADPISVDDVRLWPMDFHVCDIAECFRLASLPTHRKCQARATLFTEFFGIPYVTSTFKKTRRIWEYRDNRQLRIWYLQHGRSDAGTWAAFMRMARYPPGLRR